MANSPVLWGPNATATNLQNQELLANGNILSWNGPKNYVSYGSFENGLTTGWSLGTVTLTANLPTGVPTFGSGASGNLTIAAASSGKLAGNFSLSYDTAAASTAGNFVASQAYTIDIEDQAKVLQFSFAYKATSSPTNGNFSGTTSNSFAVAIYDVTNSAWIIPAGVFNLVQNSGVGVSTGTFQTPSNMTQFRIVVYNANASSGAITMYFDDFFVGPQIVQKGPAMSDMTAYTPTFTGLGTVSGTSAFYRRVGDSLQVWGSTVSGTSTAVALKVSLPSGLSMDSSKTGTASQVPLGYASRIESGGFYPLKGDGQWPMFYDGSDATALFIAPGNTTTNPSGTAMGKVIASDAVGSGQTLQFSFTVPIAGWSSNSVQSQDTDTRVVAASYYASGTSNPGANAQLNFDTKLYDTHAAVTTGVSWKFTAPVSGIYQVVFQGGSFGGSGADSYYLYKNGVSTFRTSSDVGSSSGQNSYPNGSSTIALVAGDFLDIRPGTAATLSGGGPPYLTHVSILRISGPAVVAASESVNARYFASATSISGSLATISWTTKDYDSHAAMNAGTYTVPVTGKYQVNSALALAGTFALNNTSIIEIQKNGSAVSRVKNYAAAAVTQTPIEISDEISCVAGDTLRIQVSSGATLPTIVSSNFENYISIFRTGN